MRGMGLSVAAMLVLTSTAAAVYPPAPGQYPPPSPSGYMMHGAPAMYPPTGYPHAEAYLPELLPIRNDMPAAPCAVQQNLNQGFAFDPCYPHQRSLCTTVCNERWVRGDWLYWQFRAMPIPPIIVTGNPALPGAGIPGEGNIIPLVGPTRNLSGLHGIRATVGQWFDPDGELGGEISAFIFGRKGTTDLFVGSDSLPLSVPVFGDDGTRGVYDYSFPGRFLGSLSMNTTSQLLGAEGSLLHRYYQKNHVSIDGLFGYRYLWLDERFELNGRSDSAGALSTFAGQTLPTGVTVFTNDSFQTNTQFHGLQVGGRMECRRDMFTVTAFGKGGMGINLHTLRAEGSSTATGFGASQTVYGGVRALPSNFGRRTNTDFSMLAETGIELGMQMTRGASVRLGYNLMWWSNVVRPTNSISPVLTLSQVPIDPSFSSTVPVGAVPVVNFRTSDFLAQGLVAGFVFEW